MVFVRTESKTDVGTVLFLLMEKPRPKFAMPFKVVVTELVNLTEGTRDAR